MAQVLAGYQAALGGGVKRTADAERAAEKRVLEADFRKATTPYRSTCTEKLLLYFVGKGMLVEETSETPPTTSRAKPSSWQGTPTTSTLPS